MCSTYLQTNQLKLILGISLICLCCFLPKKWHRTKNTGIMSPITPPQNPWSNSSIVFQDQYLQAIHAVSAVVGQSEVGEVILLWPSRPQAIVGEPKGPAPESPVSQGCPAQFDLFQLPTELWGDLENCRWIPMSMYRDISAMSNFGAGCQNFPFFDISCQSFKLDVKIQYKMSKQLFRFLFWRRTSNRHYWHSTSKFNSVRQNSPFILHVKFWPCRWVHPMNWCTVSSPSCSAWCLPTTHTSKGTKGPHSGWRQP